MLSRMVIYSVLVSALLYHDLCVAQRNPNEKFLHEASDVPNIPSYDYIIVGGGATGIPIATTLSQNYSVLVLERGGSPYGNPNISSVLNYDKIFEDSSPDASIQRLMSDDGISIVRGKVFGGGTSINAGFWSRGEEGFNKEANLLDENLILESYKWAEQVMVFQPVLGGWQTALKGALVDAGLAPDNGFTYDHIVGTKVGGTIFDQTGTRHSAADLLQYANPETLSVLLHATVQKILFKTDETSRPRAFGVAFEDRAGNKRTAYLKGGQMDEIILSAGAIASPQLLMLSGVGPENELDANKIEVVLDQPLVGTSMADNPLTTFFVPSPVPVDPSIVQVAGITPFGSYIEEAGSFNFFFANDSVYRGFSYENGGFILQKVNGPLSRGNMRLQSLDASDNPSVRFNYFDELEDLEKCVGGINIVLRAIESKEFSSFKYENMSAIDILDLNAKLPTDLPTNEITNSSLAQFCKDTVRSISHYHGGCQIGKVVDQEYKVLGVQALRVIDGSTFLRAPGTNPQASTIMLGRYMGVTILGQRLASDMSK